MEIEDQQGTDVCQVSDMSNDGKESKSLVILQVYKDPVSNTESKDTVVSTY